MCEQHCNFLRAFLMASGTSFGKEKGDVGRGPHHAVGSMTLSASGNCRVDSVLRENILMTATRENRNHDAGSGSSRTALLASSLYFFPCSCLSVFLNGANNRFLFLKLAYPLQKEFVGFSLCLFPSPWTVFLG